MTQKLFGRLRRLWLDVHLWLGVGLFIVLVPLGLSGSVLVWDHALDKALHPHRFAVTGQASLPASAYLEAAKGAFGDRAVPTVVRMPAEAGDPVIVQGRMAAPPINGRPRTLTAWIDPGAGKALDTAETRNEFIGVMHNLHGNLMIKPPLGRKVVGWLGWAMTVSSLTGLWLWWPRNGAFLKALRWRRSPSTMFNLHHMIGFWICIPLAVLSLTGVYISFPQTSRALFGVVQPPAQGGAPSRGAPEPPLPNTNTAIDAAVATAASLSKGARLTSVTLPTKGKTPSWRLAYAVEGVKTPLNLRVADKTGVAEAAKGPAQGQQDPLSRTMREVHDGANMPQVWKIIVFLGGVAPTLLGVTGTIMWLRRRSRRRHLAHASLT